MEGLPLPARSALSAQRHAHTRRLSGQRDAFRRRASADRSPQDTEALERRAEHGALGRCASAARPSSSPPAPRSQLLALRPSHPAARRPRTHFFALVSDRHRWLPARTSRHVPHLIASHRTASRRAPAPPSPNKLPRHPSSLPPIATTRMEGCKRTDNTHRCTTRTAIISPAYSPQRARTPCGTLSPQNGILVDREVICDKAIPAVC